MTSKEQNNTYLGPQAEMELFKLKAAAMMAMAQFRQEIQARVDTKTSPESKNFVIFTIDLSRANEYDPENDEDAILKRELEKRGLFNQRLGYTGFPEHLAKKLEEIGTYYDPDDADGNLMWCCLIEERDGKQVIRHEENTLIDYVLDYDSSASHGTFAIFDLNHFDKPEYAVDYEFKFKNPKKRKAALRAIVHVKLASPKYEN